MQRLPSQPTQQPPRKQLIDTAIANNDSATLSSMGLNNSERGYVVRQQSLKTATPNLAAEKKALLAKTMQNAKTNVTKEAHARPSFDVPRAVSNLGDELAGVGPGLVSTAIAAYHHPIRTAEQVGKATIHSVGETIHHPVRQAQNDPLGLISNVASAFAIPGSVVGRAGAVADAARASDVGALAKVAKVGKAAVQQPRPVERSVVTARNEAGQTTHAVHPLASINHSMGLLQKHVIDPVTQFALDHPDSPAAKILNSRLVGPQVKVGREMRAAERVKTTAAQAPAAAIARAGKKLSAAEAKAVLIKASGRPLEDWQQLEQNAIKQGIGVPKAQRAQLQLTKAAVKHMDSPRVAAAADVMKRAMDENGALKGMTEEEQLQRLGAHSLAIQHGAAGFEGLNPAQKLHDLESSLTPSPTLKAAMAERDRIANAHERVLKQEELFHQQAPKDLGFKTEPTLTAAKVQERLQQIGEERPTDPTANPPAWRRTRDNLVALRDQLAAHENGKPVEVPPAANPFRDKIVQLGHALETAQAHVDRLAPDEAATQARIAELRQQLIDEGKNVRKAGGFYTPMLRESKPLRQRVSSLVGGRQNRYGQSAVMPREEKNYPYEGGMLARGDYKTDVARVTSSAYRNTQSIAQARRVHQALYDMGKPTKAEAGGEKYAEAVRPTQAVSESLKRMANTENPLKAAKGERPLAAAIKSWYDETQAQPGEDIRYVDKRMLAPLRPYEPLMGKIGEGIDRGNQIIRVGRYLVPRYLQWLPQNFAFTAPRQGLWMARNAIKWKTEFPRLDPAVRDRIYSVMGGGPSHSLEGDNQFLAKSQEHLAGFWNKVNDEVPRAMAWIHEAESAGFHNAAGYTKLATDPKLEQKFIQVTRRANKEAGDYSLTNTERATLKKLVPSWAWDKAASQYVGRLLIEHPYLSRFLATEGSQGQKQVDAFYQHLHGLMPSWMAGVLPLNSHEGFNTSGISPTDTPAQLLQIAAGQEAPAHSLAPIPAALGELAFGRSVSGGPQSRGQTLLKTVEKFGPAREIATLTGKPGLFAAGPSAMIQDALGSPIEQVDMKQAAKSGLTTLGTRSQKDAVTRQKALEQTGAMIRATNAPPEWRKAYMVGTAAEVDRNQAKAAAQRALPKGQKLSEVQKYKITMQILLSHKMMDKSQYQKAVSAIPKMTGHQLNYWERKAWEDLGPGKILSEFRSYYHKQQEAKQKPVGAAAANG